MTEKKKEPKKEISAGIIVYRKSNEGAKFLLLYHGGSYWNFPKGKIEPQEKSAAAAFRETKEETGLSGRDLKLTKGFRANESFHFKKGKEPIFKTVIFYLAETKCFDIKLSHREHQGYGWFLFKDASRILTRYKDSQKVLKEAYSFLRAIGHKRHDPHNVSKGVPST